MLDNMSSIILTQIHRISVNLLDMLSSMSLLNLKMANQL